MIVKELVELLAKCDQDGEVVCANVQKGKGEYKKEEGKDILSVSSSTDDKTKVKETQIWFDG